MVNLTGEETEKSEDLTQVSETRHSFANSSQKSIVQLNNVCQRLMQPTSIGIRRRSSKNGNFKARKLSQAGSNPFAAHSHSQSTNGDCAHLETTGAYPAENEVVAEATQWEQRIEDILTACKTLKQSESFLSDFSSLTRDSRQNTEVDEEKSKQNTALEPSETPASSQDIIQATPLEANSYRNRKRFRNKNIMVQACSNEASNIGDGSDSEILDMHAIGLPTKKWKKHRKNSVNFSNENADSPVESDISLKQRPKNHSKHNGSLSNNLDDSEILMKKSTKKWKKSNFSLLKEANCDERDEIDILRRRNQNNASSRSADVSNSELADEIKILRRKRSNKHKKNKLWKKRILDETKTTDDEEIGQNTGRSEAAKQIMDSCESAVETSILNPSSESLNNSESNCEGESHKSEHQKRAKRKIQSEADEENDQASNTIRKKAKKKLSTVKKRRLSSDEEADEASDHSYEDADPNDSDAALKFFLGLKRFNRDFKVPRLHKIVDRASNPTADQRERIAEKGIEVKTGKFSSAEDQQIQENWLNFIQVFRLKNQPQKFFCLHAKRVTPEAKRNFLFYLARGLHNRTPYCVFKRFKLLMDRVTKGRFSQEEDDFILKAMEEKPKMSVTEVAKHLHRSLLAVSCRIGKLKTTYSRKIKWSGRNAASYIKYLLEATDIDEKDIGLLKNRQITAEEWAKLSEKLDNVPVRILKPVWLNFLHPALFIPGNSCDLGAIKWKLAKRLHKNNETEWSCIDWTKYVARFEGFTSLKLYTLVKQLIKTHVPEKKQPDLPRSLKYLMKNKLRIAAQPLKLLYKIKYRNGEIQDMRLSDL
uniref:Transcription termination factor 1 n=1 Tax=Dendroctonus ponderosae TaxID=77166 RepID=A0AAR5QBP9_DENPD